MSRFKYEIIENEAELISYLSDSEDYCQFEFPDGTEGYLTIGKITHSIKDSKCRFSQSNLPEDEFVPHLTLESEQVCLPPLVKKNGFTIPLSPDEEYIRNLAVRQLRLKERISELEKTVKELKKQVYGTTIF